MQKIKLKNPAVFISTVAGIGLIKKAPGTWGSLAGLLVAILLAKCWIAQWIIIVCGFVLGLWAIPYIIQKNTDKDPGYVVIDEFVAQLLIFAVMPSYFLNPITYVLGFAFFRLFDIFKPWPASYYDNKVHNAYGIMMDDIVAAVFSICALAYTILLSF